MENLIGQTGQANGAITPGKRGEVVLSFEGGSTTYFAYADEPIAGGARVTVVDIAPPRTVYVKPTSKTSGPQPKAPPPGTNLMKTP
jgi:hypothetical protein